TAWESARIAPSKHGATVRFRNDGGSGPMSPLRHSSPNIHEPRFWARGSNPRIIRTVEGVVIVTAIFLLVVEVIVNGGLNSIINNALTPKLPLFAVFTL